MSSLAQDPGAPPSAATLRPTNRGAALTAVILFVIGLAAAVSVDVVRDAFDIKGDESTYVAMTLSLAHDGDLSYQRRDLERFWGIYKKGPEGIFLKRGKLFRIRLRTSPPFFHVYNETPEPRNDRLYFAKAMIYAVVAAPFVRVFGMNGFLVFHILLLLVSCVCGYLFLAAGSRPSGALTFTLAFVGASVVPVYIVFLTSDLFNFALVFVAYFLWSSKEVTRLSIRFLNGPGSEVAAAVLLGMATYSKPTHLPLIAPIVLYLWWRRRFLRGFVVGGVFAVATGGLFLTNALITGEFNYQGGDRATFYGKFPFDGSPQDAWNQRELVTTNDSDAAVVLEPGEFVNRFAINVEYFLIGRHFGFVPYFFPGVIAFLAWAFSRERRVAWRWLNLVGIAGSALGLLLFAPYSWSGGGGPPGNRYFLSIYPALFFLMPPLGSPAPAILAWLGGALFTAKILINPFASAKYTWQITQRGFARRLPVELTMAPDLPVMLDTSIRGRIPYRTDPFMLLYFLDQHAYPPEPPGMWVAGDGRAEIIVRTEEPVDHLAVAAFSPIHTVFSMSFGAGTVTKVLEPRQPTAFELPASGVRGLNSYAYLMTAISSGGFTPRLQDPGSRDGRNLAVLVNFRAVTKGRKSDGGGP